MNSPTWTIVKKDFQHLWVFLAVWWGILIIEAIYAVHGLGELFTLTFKTSDELYDIADGFTNRLIPCFIADLVILFFVVIETVKADSPTDERAEWRTRPVGRARLLLAKMLFIVLACYLVPGVIETIERLYAGFGWHYCFVGLAQFALVQSACVTIAALATLLFRRVLAGLLTFAAGGAVVYFIVLWLIRPGNDPDSYRYDLSTAYREGWASNWIYLGLPLATAFAVIALIYANQRRWFGWLILIVSLLATWPSTIWGIRAYREAYIYKHMSPPPTTQEVKMDLVLSKHIEKYPYPQEGDPANPYDWHTFVHLANFDGPTLNGKIFDFYFRGSNLSWPGERKTYKNVESDGLGNDYHYAEGVEAAGYGRLATYQPDNIPTFGLICLSNAELARAQREPARWSGSAYFRTFNLQPVFDVPLIAGAAWMPGTVSRIVPGFGPDTHHNVAIRLEDASPAAMPVLSPSDPVYGYQAIYLLYNPQTKESIQGFYPNDIESTSVSYLNFVNLELDFDFTDNKDATGQHLSCSTNEEIKKWLADAHLVELRMVEDREFYCPVTIDPFLVPKDASPDAPLLTYPQ